MNLTQNGATPMKSAVHPNEYRKLLLAKRAELCAKLRPKFDMMAGLGRMPVEDQVPISGEEFISLQLNGLHYEQLKLVDAALDRLESGDYGICVDCGDRISPKRLAAIPWASRCVVCQGRTVAEPDREQNLASAA
jgi:DnaK suppressor protein